MNNKTTGTVWAIGLALGILGFQVGCQQQEAPPVEPAVTGPGATSSGGTTAAQPTPATTPANRASQPAAPAAAPAPRTATLAAGTTLKVRTTNTVSTKAQKTGDSFVATLEEPLVQGEWVIAPKGITVEGSVVEADQGGRVKGVAPLTVALKSFRTADGQPVNISTNTVTIEADTTKAKDATKVAIGTGIGAAIGAIAGGKKGAGIGAATGAGAGTAVVLGTRGDAAEITSETVVEFQLSSPVTVAARK